MQTIVALKFPVGGLFSCRKKYKNDPRPDNYKIKSVFRVLPDAIESNGRSFKKEDIHRIVIKNGYPNSGVRTSYIAPANSLASVANHSRMTHEARVESISYALEVETGGKAYFLAGGMDDTTANGLLTDVCRIIG